MSNTSAKQSKRPLRWWPCLLILSVATIAILVVQSLSEFPFQRRNLISLPIGAGALLLLIFWWLFFSRASTKVRLLSLLGLVLLVGGGFATLRIHGVTGDLIPIIEFKGAEKFRSSSVRATAGTANQALRRVPGEYPHFLGPNRTGILTGPSLDSDWGRNPPVELWRKPVGAAWSGFAVVGDRALTLEQNGAEEQVLCFQALTGALLWTATNSGRYANPIGGEGPRSTPTVADGRVLTLGSNGWLQCLDLSTGRRLWGTNVVSLTGASVPEWGVSGSPLVAKGRVYVGAGGRNNQSLLIFDVGTGELIGAGGSGAIDYASPSLVTLAGQEQILVVNHHEIAAHNPLTGAQLWKRTWGTGFPLVANPIVVSSNRFLVTAGYGVGAELFEIQPDSSGVLGPKSVWVSKRLKAKFSNPVLHDGYVYGLDDGILACLDIRDGSQKWKEGRYGHGQGVWINDLYLLMAENGEMILMRPTTAGSGELGRYRAFKGKTWNPIALAGDLVLARSDREAACFRLVVH